MSKRICSHPGCENPHRAKGFCGLHYGRFRQGHKMDAPKRVFDPGGACLVEGCGHPHVARGYCNAHYLRLKRGQSIESKVRKRPAGKGCAVESCDRPHSGRGYCALHHLRLSRGADIYAPLPISDSTERFWSKVDACTPTECWEWLGVRTEHGYGTIEIDGNRRIAHRWSWEQVNGPIEEGKVIDHKCRNRSCVNPRHLQVVTHPENMQNLDIRGKGRSGFRGVHWDGDRGKWRARAQLNNKQHGLGSYEDPNEAAEAISRWRRENMPNSLMDKGGMSE